MNASSKGGRRSFEDRLDEIFGPDDGRTSEGAQISPTAAAVPPGPSMVGPGTKHVDNNNDWTAAFFASDVDGEAQATSPGQNIELTSGDSG